MSIITTFPGIERSVVYRFCFLAFLDLFLMKLTTIFSAILSLCRFGDHVLLFSGSTAMMLVFQASYSQISWDFFFTPPTDQKPGNLFDAKRTKRGWSNPYGFFSGFLTILLLRISVYLSFVLFCSFFFGEITETETFQRHLYIPFGDSRARIKKWKTRWFIDRKGSGVGLGLVTALRFTRELSNGPEKLKEKRLWTD